jgi:type 2 lantibiotic biosynthesis protein LanM
MSEFYETAQSIGARLCRDAIWSRDRCNWIGASMEGIGQWTVVQKSFGPDLYSGTSGIGILLAELAALNGERIFRKTAEAAAAQALSRVGDIPEQFRMGFYSGHAGIAYALVRIGEKLGVDSLVDKGFALMEDLARLNVDEQGIDVVSGVAGAIPPLLLINQKSGRQALLDLAIRCADRLERVANKSDNGWSWKTIDMPGQERDLTGFSHGTAGIAWALLELDRVTGERRYRDAAEQAFRYERHWFSAEHENWPDFRGGMPQPAQQPNSGPSYSVAWCHGAPGIGLSRLRAFELTGDAVCEQEANAAVRTTIRYLQMPQAVQSSYSLCHGAAGNAEFVLESARVLKNDEHRQTAERIAQQGIAWFESARGPWPCGVMGGGETPNLLLGTAGIGMFYLRLDDPARVRSVLMVGPGAN